MKKLIKSSLGHILFATGRHKRALEKQATIVLFHRVDDRLAGNPISCTVADFRAYCSFFKRHFEVIGLSELLDRCDQKRDIGGTLVITFDDGYLDNYVSAVPILEEFGLPACFYVSTAFPDSQHVPWWDKELPFRPQWMSWRHLSEMADRGFEIGAHTDTHVDLGQIDVATAKSEIELSKHKLEQHLGREVPLFSYPYGGRANIREETLALVPLAGFRSCVSAYGGSVRATDDVYRWQRVPISPWFSTPEQFGFELVAQARANRKDLVTTT
jgi:peptidoglycan/xylan/chitin deacetylase (PgdA/CDA1 family)